MYWCQFQISCYKQPPLRKSEKYFSYCESTDAKCEDVCDAGDCDRHSCVLHGQSYPLRQGQSQLGLLLHQIVPAGHDHKHVINTNTCTWYLVELFSFAIWKFSVDLLQ